MSEVSVGREAFSYNGRGSACPLSDHHYAASTAADIYDAAKEYAGCEIELECYTPPYEPPLTAESARGGGYVVIHLISGSQPRACVGVEFGRVDDEGRPLRATMNAAEWREDRTNPLYSGVYAANFDEAWRVVCLLGLMLGAVGVRVSYGN